MADKFLYSIVTTDGRRVHVEAESAEDALRVAGIKVHECRRFYPFPIKRLPSEAEKIERAARLAMLRERFNDRRAKIRMIARNKIEA